jgi:methionine synthase II (cobalamin-independent)
MFFIDDHGNKIAVPLLRIHDRLKWKSPVHADEFKYLQGLTRRTVKITMPSPTIAYSADGRNIDKGVYSDLAELREDVADAYRKEFRALADAGLNLDFLVAQVIGRKYSAVIGFENEADADKASVLIKKAGKK